MINHFAILVPNEIFLNKICSIGQKKLMKKTLEEHVAVKPLDEKIHAMNANLIKNILLLENFYLNANF